ncbi:phosphopyruvate hydratase [Bacteriovoracaceae bacterium]|nr:phosphopyruvate hydratase [Bacteriovoracaceae bacterium]
MTKIASIKAREILDSRGNPTVEVEMTSENGLFARSSVPSGASTGSKEAIELRDGNKEKYFGKGVQQAVDNITNKIFPAIKEMDLFDYKTIDQKMLELDGTENKSNLGANALLAVSMNVVKLGALEKKKSLFKYLREDCNCPVYTDHSDKYIMPKPLMNIINGGAHATNNLDIQEFMIIPQKADSFKENLRIGAEIFHTLKKVLMSKNLATGVGDEGGFAPNLESHEQAFTLMSEAIEKAGYVVGKDVVFALDCASSEFFNTTDKMYTFEGEKKSATELINYYKTLCEKYPLYSIEDGMDENDIDGWKSLTQELGKEVKMVGDDLFVTNPTILQQGIADKWANSILIKLNQIGTVSETLHAINLAKEAGFSSIISHRSGETADSFIADLTVATNSGHIKTGSLCRTDRIEKYNQLMRIEEEI